MALDCLRIATRKSPLAMWQAEYVRARLVAQHADLQVDIVPMTTQGDRILDTPLAKIGGKGLFVKELEQALLDGRADIAVHSMKDVPVEFPPGLELTVICARESPYDAFVSNRYDSFEAMPQGAVVGTSSLRRRCQLLAARPDLDIRDLRGNVNTRLTRLDDNQYDAIILACAGLIRLGMLSRIVQPLSEQLSLPAVGQGAVGIETRVGDAAVRQYLLPLHHASTAVCVWAERAMNAALHGGCQVPIAGYAIVDQGQLWLRGRVGEPAGGRLLQAQARADIDQAEQLGQQVAAALLQQGAADILAAVYGQ